MSRQPGVIRGVAVVVLCCLWVLVSGCTALGLVTGYKLDHPSQQAMVSPWSVR